MGHKHSYERTLPVYKGEVYNGSAEAAYTNPGAPVHIKTGSAVSLYANNAWVAQELYGLDEFAKFVFSIAYSPVRMRGMRYFQSAVIPFK